MFGYARDHQVKYLLVYCVFFFINVTLSRLNFNFLLLLMKPCIIFMDEIDAIGGRRFSEGTSADREIQRTLMELLNQLDGFDQLGKVYPNSRLHLKGRELVFACSHIHQVVR